LLIQWWLQPFDSGDSGKLISEFANSGGAVIFESACFEGHGKNLVLPFD
jgi:hypothetical protein